MLRAIDISTSGLVAQRQRMNTVAGNIANINTTKTSDDPTGAPTPFQRRIITFSTATSDTNREPGGVGVDYEVQIDTATAPRLKNEPGHPHADADGNVHYPNISLVTEFTNALEASRAYEANVAAIEMSKQLAELSLHIIA